MNETNLLYVDNYWKKGNFLLLHLTCKDNLNDKWIKEELLNWRQVKVEIPQERIEEISQIKDPNLVKSKGRPKGQKRILGLL